MKNSSKNLIHIETMGCRLNQIESEAIANVFMQSGFQVSMQNISAKTLVNAEIPLCIVNTCTVTQKSEQKARRQIRLILKLFPNSSVLITGCYAQLSGEKLKKIDERICIVGGQIKSRISKIPIMLKKEIESGTFLPSNFSKKIEKEITLQPQKKIGFPENSFSLSTSTFLAHSRASLKIQDGCNSNCSYCAIHLARGHSVSIEVSLALQRVKELEDKGYAEVVLTSVNLCQYKSEYNGKTINFSKLLAILLDKTEKINFRISSIYPQLIDEEFCQVIKNERVRPHFHISVQSGSDKILSLMSRSYKAYDVLLACQKLRESKKDCFIACDIITGFPCETDEDFEQTLSLCKKCNFSWIHAFPFSERPGTYACELKDKVPQSLSTSRAKKLFDLAIENKIKYLDSFLGLELLAIPETIKNPLVVSSLNEKALIQNTFESNFQYVSYFYHAVTPNFIHCQIKSKKKLDLKTEVKVKIIKIFADQIKKGGDIEVEAELV